MYNELTNLLPLVRQRMLGRVYLLRLGTVVLVTVALLAGAAAILLLPTYIYLSQSAGDKEKLLASLESKLSSAEEKAISARLALLTGRVQTLSALRDVPPASNKLNAVFQIAHPGVKLSGFSYTPAAKKAPTTIAVSGVAATRDALRNYQLALQQAPFASSASLPVSAYAKDTDIAFTISVALTP